MNKTKIVLMAALAISLLLGFAAYLYTYKISDYSYERGSEFHIYPEEYDKNYSENTETILLEKNTDYRIEVDASCQAGTMELIIHCGTEEDRFYTVAENAPFHEVIELPRGAADEVTITIQYNADTEGTLAVKIFTHKHYFFI